MGGGGQHGNALFEIYNSLAGKEKVTQKSLWQVLGKVLKEKVLQKSLYGIKQENSLCDWQLGKPHMGKKQANLTLCPKRRRGGLTKFELN